jgi:hypothetical protein
MNLEQAKNLVALNWELEQQKKDKNGNIKPLIEKLEYWFEQHPEGFFKHCESGIDQDNLGSLSWTQELLISKPTFKKAFKEIGVCYLSPEQFEQTKDKFQDKFYCSVLHPLNNNRTIYYRNDELINVIVWKWFYGTQSRSYLNNLIVSVNQQLAAHAE